MMDRAVLWVIALVAVWAVATCSLHDPTPTYRYRLTVEVETPEGPRSGSSIIEVDTSSGGLAIPTLGEVSSRVRGEAVAVDLPSGPTLFALLRSEDHGNWANFVMLKLAAPHQTEIYVPFEEKFKTMLAHSGPIEVPAKWRAGYPAETSAYPMLVTFGDPANPTSIKRVDPNDLHSTYGLGVRLSSITVQLVEEGITTSNIDGRLPWLRTLAGSIGERPEGGSIDDLPVEQRLTRADFRRSGD